MASIVDLTFDTAEKTSELRAAYNISTPDAIQLATSWQENVDYFITNDKDLVDLKLQFQIMLLPGR